MNYSVRCVWLAICLILQFHFTVSLLGNKPHDNSKTDPQFNDPQSTDPGKGPNPGADVMKGGNSVADPALDSLAPLDSGLDGFLAEFPTSTTEGPPQPPPEINMKPAKRIKVLPTMDGPPLPGPDGRPCEEAYRPHDKVKAMYLQRVSDGGWIPMKCSDTGLVWREDLCNCGEELLPTYTDDPCWAQGYRPSPNDISEYKREIFGYSVVMHCPGSLIWSQKGCRCIHNPKNTKRPMVPIVTFRCKTILNLTFEKTLDNTAAAYRVLKVPLGQRGRLPRLHYIESPGSDGFAAQLSGQPLKFLAYRGNDFQKQVTYTMNFKIRPRLPLRRRKQFMVLFTDGCKRNENGLPKTWPSNFNLTFQPSTKSFRLVFNTKLSMVDEIISGVQPDKYGWFKTVVYFEDKTVNLEVNGKKLLTATNVEGNFPQASCPLYIGGRGSGYGKSDHFFGLMDNIFLVKDCKFHDANIKLL